MLTGLQILDSGSSVTKQPFNFSTRTSFCTTHRSVSKFTSGDDNFFRFYKKKKKKNSKRKVQKV